MIPFKPFSKPNMSQDQKRVAIIEAALKRFAHFGVAKTTMSEIGADLAISKASLYYYFPDKINLYAAVLQRIIEQNQAEINPKLEAEKDPLQAMQLFLEVRTDFIIKYYNVLVFLKGRNDIPEELQPLFARVRERELQLVRGIVEKGQVAGLFDVNATKDSASLLFDCLEGLREVYLGRKTSFFPEKKQFLDILKREKELTRIFFRGISN
ncbi:MAG TPA: TetR/AcrR family transcriptional regulator [Chitinophagaceae bacterium]|nr:TetR/AcrR family transcriptional regulator [Chitinophagaceae bacterium]